MSFNQTVHMAKKISEHHVHHNFCALIGASPFCLSSWDARGWEEIFQVQTRAEGEFVHLYRLMFSVLTILSNLQDNAVNYVQELLHCIIIMGIRATLTSGYWCFPVISMTFELDCIDFILLIGSVAF